ncbi:LPS export ABC transporter periplasmic protein LptC [Marinicella rhabdoformis]|uniref:LPS export ABC transporter periplasmic protein LptC n=1 Tax=Marinicella rhabdoformis TaxID=2580566 RepID=UPI0012AEB37D|nr:LPS export ABC transporter periplasmic protein LptC [Marinicella rhabdoformis]
MKESNYFRSLIIFAVLAAISYGLYEYQFADDSEWQFKPFTKGYALFDSEIQMTDEAGQIHTSIVAPEMVFYANSEETKIKQPIITYQAGKVRWKLESELALINANQSEITFPERVSINTLATENNTTIITQALTLFPETKLAKSSAELSMVSDTMSMTGKGSVIDLTLQQIEVLDETHAEFSR